MYGLHVCVLTLLSVVALHGCIVRGQQGGPTALAYGTPDTCIRGREFFQTGNLSCLQCGENQITSRDGLSCECGSGYIRPANSIGSTFQCAVCGSSQVASCDGLFCLQCQSGSTQTGQCTPCNQTAIYSDILPPSPSGVGSRSCIACPEGTWADETGFQCVQCGVSSCQQCTIVADGVCFASALLSPPAGVFSYYSEHFSAAVALCRLGNQTACQLLANLCVLQTYSRDDPACEQSRTLAVDILPALYYPERGADEVLARTDIRTQFVVREGAQGSLTLPLVVVSFALNGTLLGVQNISDQILLCQDRPSHTRAAWRAGVTYQTECSLSLSELSATSNSPVFYDIFLRDRGGNVDQLYPIPVLVQNYRDATRGEVNRGSDPGSWQFVRRFYLAESVTSAPQYARTMELRVMLNSNGMIFPPYLLVSYNSWSPNTESSGTLPASFSVEYHQDSSGFDIGIAVAISVLAVLGVAYTGFKVNGFLRRSGGLCCELHTYIYLAVEVCAALSTMTFMLLTVACTFWLIFFKAQSTLFILLPVGTQQLVFQILLGIALLFRILYTVYLVWHQCTIDIFFIDWERPRGVLLTTNPNAEQPVAAMPTTITSPVSIWRTYFVANEWNEIQSLRKTNPALLLLLTLLFLSVVGFEHLAERDPSSSIATSQQRYSAPHSPLLRFSLTSLTYLITAIVLRLYVFLIYERFFEHKIKQFVDLCSVSNISVFIMSRKLFGFYIHGRSVHGHADTNLREMNHNLHKEQEDMCGQRGLSADSDNQTFGIALSRQFRTHYDTIIAPMQAERAEGQVRANVGQGGQNRPSQGLSEAGLKAYENMNQFLSAFIERSIRELDYVVKDKLFLEKVLGMEFYDAMDRSLFYNDPGFSFDSVLFYGNEWALLQLDILVFAVVDLLAQNYVLAAIITYIVSWVLGFIRDALGRRNLAKKTLVDDRFLI